MRQAPTHHDVQKFPTVNDAKQVRESLGFLVQQVIDTLSDPVRSPELLESDQPDEFMNMSPLPLRLTSRNDNL